VEVLLGRDRDLNILTSMWARWRLRGQFPNSVHGRDEARDKTKKNMVTEDDIKKNQKVHDTEWVSAIDQLPKCLGIVKNTFLTGCSSNF
jgi:hypothetical protein